MTENQTFDPEEFLQQQRLISDLALWSGLNPADLQPYIGFQGVKDVDREAEVKNNSEDRMFSSMVATLDNYREE